MEARWSNIAPGFRAQAGWFEISLLGPILTVPDEFSAGWKFVHLGVPFTQSHAKRTKV